MTDEATMLVTTAGKKAHRQAPNTMRSGPNTNDAEEIKLIVYKDDLTIKYVDFGEDFKSR